MNPAMSSWLALRHRASLQPGQSVLVLGATGNAGRLAIDVARHLGAGRVVAAARNVTALEALTDAATVRLDDADGLAKAGADIDVVLDYLWGEPTAAALRAIIPARTDDTQPLHWIQIGSVAGLTAPIPSAALRAVNLHLKGSGQGSVPTATILADLPSIATAVSSDAFAIRTRTIALADIERGWTDPPSDGRPVVVP